MFWPTSTCQILIKFSFLESLWHKETSCTSFAKKMQIFWKHPVKRMNVSFVIFGHKTWDLEGGGANWLPPPHILVFKYPSRDRVKVYYSSADFFIKLEVTFYHNTFKPNKHWISNTVSYIILNFIIKKLTFHVYRMSIICVDEVNKLLRTFNWSIWHCRFSRLEVFFW